MMSLSKSANFEHAQATIQCDHCGVEEDVKHYCLICEETMCPTCKTIHNKARATRDHQVVLREERYTKNEASTFCKKHPDQKTSLHCDMCKAPVCTHCIAESHYGHKFSDILTVLNSTKREIKDSKKQMETRMRTVDALIYECEQSWNNYEKKVKDIESSILHDAVTLHALVDKIAQKRKDELEKIKNQDRITWETSKSLLDKEKSKISLSLEQHDRRLSSTTTTGMDELLKESKVLRGKQLDFIEVSPPCYQSSLNIFIEGIGKITKQSNDQSTVRSTNFKTGKAVFV